MECTVNAMVEMQDFYQEHSGLIYNRIQFWRKKMFSVFHTLIRTLRAPERFVDSELRRLC